MSHAATNWAILQRGLKPAAKIVLWNLADRHNADTRRCDPSQEKLAHDCEMSRSTLNLHLQALEDARLVRRIRRSNPETHRKMTTYYQLAFDTDLTSPDPESEPEPEPTGNDEKPQDVVGPCLKSGHGSMSEKSAKPCPNSGQSRVRNSDINPVREPGKEPARAHASGRPPDQGLVGRASLIMTGMEHLCRGISAASARQCIAAGMVTEAQCRDAGIDV